MADDAVADTTPGSADHAWAGSAGKLYEHQGTVATIEMGARQYVAALGRFLEVDPINRSDLTGKCICIVFAVVAAGLLATVSLYTAAGKLSPTSRAAPKASSPLPAPSNQSKAKEKEIFVYRIWGGAATKWGASWTPINPILMSNPRAQLGLPNVNFGEHLTMAKVWAVPDVVKLADALDGNPGGEQEWLFFTAAAQLEEVATIDVDY